jgi:hypothetical protein
MTRDHDAMYVDAYEATKAATRWVYRNNYAGGPITISAREPNARTIHFTGVRSWDYAKQAGVTTSTALVHLRALVRRGKLIEEKRFSTTCSFKVPEAVAIEIGREIIVELVADGLPFDDELRASRA